MTSVQVVGSLRPSPDTWEVGHLAVWSVTTAKPANGVDALRDGREDTYWQSDGMQPHLINIHFQKKVRVSMLAVLLNFKLDESYTPRQLKIRGGSTFADLQELQSFEVSEPQGWVIIPLADPGSARNDIKLFLLQLMILNNHQNGKDTHVREVKVFGPRESPIAPLLAPQANAGPGTEDAEPRLELPRSLADSAYTFIR